MPDEQTGEGGFLRKGWDHGEKAMDEAKERDAERRKGYVNRFWMKPGDQTSVIFVDGDPAIFWEHQLYRKQHWRNWYTCVQGLSGRECPLCKLGDYAASNVAAFTVINRTVFVDKKGGEHSDEINLFVCKMGSLEQLNIQRDRRGGLAGAEFIINRTNADAVNVGDVHDFQRTWNPEELGQAFPKLLKEGERIIHPYDYLEQFAPKSDEELNKIAGFTATGGQSQTTATGSAPPPSHLQQPAGNSDSPPVSAYEEDIPF